MRVFGVAGVAMLGVCAMAWGQRPTSDTPAVATSGMNEKTVPTIRANAKLVSNVTAVPVTTPDAKPN